MTDVTEAMIEAGRDVFPLVSPETVTAIYLAMTAARECVDQVEGVDLKDCLLGLYTVHWLAGGTSVASVYMDETGKRWVAPTNWIRPGPLESEGWSGVEKIEPIATLSTRKQSPDVEAIQRALVDHSDQLRSACNVADRDGRDTNWLTLRGCLHYTLAEHQEITNEARKALGAKL